MASIFRIVRTFPSSRYPQRRDMDSTAYSDDGGATWRWESNNSVAPLDACREHGIPCDEAAQAAAREAELVAFAAAYRARQPKQPSAEQRAEARAAHGAGVVLVDVLTGRRFTT